MFASCENRTASVEAGLLFSSLSVIETSPLKHPVPLG